MLFFRNKFYVSELTFTVIIYISHVLGYEQVRIKYHAYGAFPHLYDKIKPEINVVEVGKQYMDPLWCNTNQTLKKYVINSIKSYMNPKISSPSQKKSVK